MNDEEYPHWKSDNCVTNFDTYHAAVAHAFPKYDDENILGPGLKLSEAAMGIAEESGEIAHTLRRVIFREQPLDQATVDHLLLEIGDLYSWLNFLSTELGSSMLDVANRHANKINNRYPNSKE